MVTSTLVLTTESMGVAIIELLSVAFIECVELMGVVNIE